VTLHVVFVVAGVEYALPVACVLQMESFSGATPVPGTPAYVAGIVTVRGRIVPVLDLRQRFGLPSLEPTLDTRIILCQLTDRVVALRVDSAREVLPLDPALQQAAPEMLSARSAGLVHAMHANGTRLLLLLDLPQVLGDHENDRESLLPALDVPAHRRPALPG
jgi:purine-binding chemotaxis protein CheW